MLNFNCRCPIEATLGVIGGKWKLLIYRELYVRGTRRFGELREGVQGISAKVLTQQLKELEADGVILRTVYPEIPPRVEYSLTYAGRSLEKVFLAMLEWGTAFLNREIPFPAPPALSAPEEKEKQA